MKQQQTPDPAAKAEQKIRSMAKRANLIAHKSRKDGKWYFANVHNILMSPNNGLNEDQAMEFLQESDK